MDVVPEYVASASPMIDIRDLSSINSSSRGFSSVFDGNLNRDTENENVFTLNHTLSQGYYTAGNTAGLSSVSTEMPRMTKEEQKDLEDDDPSATGNFANETAKGMMAEPDITKQIESTMNEAINGKVEGYTPGKIVRYSLKDGKLYRGKVGSPPELIEHPTAEEIAAARRQGVIYKEGFMSPGLVASATTLGVGGVGYQVGHKMGKSSGKGVVVGILIMILLLFIAGAWIVNGVTNIYQRKPFKEENSFWITESARRGSLSPLHEANAKWAANLKNWKSVSAPAPTPAPAPKPETQPLTGGAKKLKYKPVTKPIKKDKKPVNKNKKSSTKKDFLF